MGISQAVKIVEWENDALQWHPVLQQALLDQGLPYSGIRAPLTIRASSEHRYSIAEAISSGVLHEAFLDLGSRSRA